MLLVRGILVGSGSFPAATSCRCRAFSPKSRAKASLSSRHVLPFLLLHLSSSPLTSSPPPTFFFFRPPPLLLRQHHLLPRASPTPRLNTSSSSSSISSPTSLSSSRLQPRHLSARICLLPQLNALFSPRLPHLPSTPPTLSRSSHVDSHKFQVFTGH